MVKEPQFQYRTIVAGDVRMSRSQMKLLWNLKHGAICETWLGMFPMARMWTAEAGWPISPATITSLHRRKFIKKAKTTKDDRGRLTIRWAISRKGEKVMEVYN